MALFRYILFYLVVLCYISGLSCSDFTQKLQVKREREKLDREQAVKSAEELGLKMPEFENKRDEIMWKLNLAKKTLKKAREIEGLAKKAAVHFGYFKGNKQRHVEVAQLLGRADDTIMNAGEKMGFDFEKY